MLGLVASAKLLRFNPFLQWHYADRKRKLAKGFKRKHCLQRAKIACVLNWSILCCAALLSRNDKCWQFVKKILSSLAPTMEYLYQPWQLFICLLFKDSIFAFPFLSSNCSRLEWENSQRRKRLSTFELCTISNDCMTYEQLKIDPPLRPKGLYPPWLSATWDEDGWGGRNGITLAFYYETRRS